MKKLDAIVYIGRFQPFTNAHYQIVSTALRLAKKVIVFIGSAKVARSTRNPWTAEERKDMISAIKDFKDRNIEFVLQPNSNYNTEGWWVKDVQSKVKGLTKKDDKIGIIGFKKDSSSFYLDLFPQWDFIKVNDFGISATPIRESFFTTAIVDWNLVHPDIKNWILNWKERNPNFYNYIFNEFEHINKFKEQYKNYPYPPTFITTDAMVICKGHILLIHRKYNPGKDLYAMPGGFLNVKEKLVDCCIRELKEETKIDINKLVLKNNIKMEKYFDDPYRDPRGRSITHCFLFNLKLKDLPIVKGSDDAYGAQWIPSASSEPLTIGKSLSFKLNRKQ